VQHRDRLGERDGHVVVGGGLPGGPGGLAFEFDEPFGGGVRLSRLEPGEVVGEGRVAAAGPAELGSGARVGLPVDRVVRFAVDGLARGEAEGLGAGSPPAAGWFAGLGGVNVVPADSGFCGVVLDFPDVAEVVALGDGDDYGQYGGLLSRGGGAAAGLPMIITVNATVCVIGTRMNDQRFMIITVIRAGRCGEARKCQLTRKKIQFDIEQKTSVRQAGNRRNPRRVRRTARYGR
jgi:hypothetical protein